MEVLLAEKGEITAVEILAVTRLGESRRKNVETTIAGGRARTLVARRGSSIEGAVAWSGLDWDSGIFGFPAARLEFMIAAEGKAGVLDRLCRAALDDAGVRGIRHITARVNASDLAGIQALERAGFEMIDGIQTFSLPLDDRVYLEGPARRWVRDYRPSDLDPLCEIARRAYIHDRFHADSALPEGAADRAHYEWVRNSCLKKAADHVIVAEWESRPAGFVTCRLNRNPGLAPTGVILLVATDASARGRGLARAATLGSLDWFRSQGAASVEVGTQFRNIPAGRLYETCGFRLTATSVTLRKAL